MEFYHRFDDVLLEKLKDLISEILDGSQIPDSWRYSTTTLIPKEGKDKEDLANYQPIALWISTIRSLLPLLQFEKDPSVYYSPGSKCFFPKRTLQENIWTTLNVLEYYKKHSDK